MMSAAAHRSDEKSLQGGTEQEGTGGLDGRLCTDRRRLDRYALITIPMVSNKPKAI